MIINYKEFFDKGFTISNFPLLSSSQISLIKEKLDTIHKIQLEESNQELITSIGEGGVIRSPLIYDNYFVDLLTIPEIQNILSRILGEYYILSLQNAIVVSPNQDHHQSFYHRDIIHQTFTSSKPIGVNVYFCLDDYSPSTGGTTFVPKSHKLETLPLIHGPVKEETPLVKKGHVLFFDSMIYHKAGTNTSSDFRYGINHMYTLPFIKQQINLPYVFKEKYSEFSSLGRILGYQSKEFISVDDFRNYRYKKILK